MNKDESYGMNGIQFSGSDFAAAAMWSLSQLTNRCMPLHVSAQMLERPFCNGGGLYYKMGSGIPSKLPWKFMRDHMQFSKSMNNMD